MASLIWDRATLLHRVKEKLFLFYPNKNLRLIYRKDKPSAERGTPKLINLYVDLDITYVAKAECYSKYCCVTFEQNRIEIVFHFEVVE